MDSHGRLGTNELYANGLSKDVGKLNFTLLCLRSLKNDRRINGRQCYQQLRRLIKPILSVGNALRARGTYLFLWDKMQKILAVCRNVNCRLGRSRGSGEGDFLFVVKRRDGPDLWWCCDLSEIRVYLSYAMEC